MAWGKAGSTTLGSAGDDLDITSMTANDFNQFLVHSIASGNMKHNFRFDDNSGSVYARGRSHNSAGKSNDSSQAQIEYHGDGALDRFEVVYGVNLTGEEKLQIHSDITQGGSGSGTAPDRALAVSKAVITCQYTRVDVFNDASGDFDTGSNITVLGSDMTTDAGVTAIGGNLQDNSLFVEKDTARRYWFTAAEDFDFSASSSGAVSNQPTDATEVGQLITSTTHRGKKAKSATFYVKRTGSPGGTMVYKIRKSSDNSVVATSTGTSASALSTSTTAVTLDFNDEVIPNEDIRVTVSGVTGSSGNVITIFGGGADTVADQTLSVWGGSSWTEYGNDSAGKLTFIESWNLQPTYQTFYDDTKTWTKTGTKTTVNETVSGKVNWNFSSNYTSAENHVETTPLGFTLDNEKWICDFEFNASDFDNSAEAFLVVFQENAGDFISTSGDAFAVSIYSNKTIRLWKKDGSSHSIDSNTNAITIATGTDYYARFSRTSATVIKFELFTDSARTTHVSGSPITFTFSETIQGLDNLTHCGRSDNVGATRTYNVSLDNLKIYNGVTSIN